MTDIVEKLKERRSIDGSMIYVEMTEKVLDEAVTEIERLRATVVSQDAKLMASWPPDDALKEIHRLIVKLADLEGYYGPVPDRSGPAFKDIKQ